LKSACPDHPLLRETRREVLNDILDVPSALAWINERPADRFRRLPGLSPFAAAWIERGEPEFLRFEPPALALKRLHARLVMHSQESRL
jgi:ATP-dependent Lhr-like helicase